jgi:hypothetical protein
VIQSMMECCMNVHAAESTPPNEYVLPLTSPPSCPPPYTRTRSDKAYITNLEDEHVGAFIEELQRRLVAQASGLPSTKSTADLAQVRWWMPHPAVPTPPPCMRPKTATAFLQSSLPHSAP